MLLLFHVFKIKKKKTSLFQLWMEHEKKIKTTKQHVIYVASREKV